MNRIPSSALILGLAGLIPFLWGTATAFNPTLAELGQSWFGPRFISPHIQLFYGTIILSFMSGVLWGFATRATGSVATTGYALSVLPALWAFFFVGGGPTSAATYLITGYLGLLALDYMFWKQELSPPWWMQLRILLSVVVIACLAVVAF